MSNRFLAISCCLVFGVIALSRADAVVPLAGHAMLIPHSFISLYPSSLVPDCVLVAITAAPTLDDAPRPFVPEHARPKPIATTSRRSRCLRRAGATEQREEYADALRCYQRALRLDPGSPAIVSGDHCSGFAAETLRRGRPLRAFARQTRGVDPLQLHQLGARLVEQGDFARAAAIYEKTLAAWPIKTDARRRALEGIGQSPPARRRNTSGRPSVLPSCWPPPTSRRSTASTSRSRLCCFPTGHIVPDHRRVFPGRRSAARRGGGVRQSRKARARQGDAAVQPRPRAPKTGKPAEALAALESAFGEHLGDQGAAPFETLADALNNSAEAAS